MTPTTALRLCPVNSLPCGCSAGEPCRMGPARDTQPSPTTTTYLLCRTCHKADCTCKQPAAPGISLATLAALTPVAEPVIPRNAPLTIRRVGNGFMVTPVREWNPADPGRRLEAGPAETLVFQRLDGNGLLDFLTEHFDAPEDQR